MMLYNGFIHIKRTTSKLRHNEDHVFGLLWGVLALELNLWRINYLH